MVNLNPINASPIITNSNAVLSKAWEATEENRGVKQELDPGRLLYSFGGATLHFAKTGNIIEVDDYKSFGMGKYDFLNLTLSLADLIQRGGNGNNRSLTEMAQFFEEKISRINEAGFSDERRELELQVWEDAFVRAMHSHFSASHGAANASNSLTNLGNFAVGTATSILNSGASQAVQDLMLQGLHKTMTFELSSITSAMHRNAWTADTANLLPVETDELQQSFDDLISALNEDITSIREAAHLEIKRELFAVMNAWLQR